MSTSRTEKPSKKALPADADSQRIVEAARAHFFSHGFRSVTMDDLGGAGDQQENALRPFPE